MSTTSASVPSAPLIDLAQAGHLASDGDEIRLVEPGRIMQMQAETLPGCEPLILPRRDSEIILAGFWKTGERELTLRHLNKLEDSLVIVEEEPEPPKRRASKKRMRTPAKTKPESSPQHVGRQEFFPKGEEVPLLLAIALADHAKVENAFGKPLPNAISIAIFGRDFKTREQEQRAALRRRGLLVRNNGWMATDSGHRYLNTAGIFPSITDDEAQTLIKEYRARCARGEEMGPERRRLQAVRERERAAERERKAEERAQKKRAAG